ncbi:MAG: hypothetical protein AAGF06_06275 [Pseudomonadota bacterium]
MTQSKRSTSKLKKTVGWHRQLAWVGGLLLCLFIVSAMTHPLLTWTGPQPVKMRPPSLSVGADSLSSLVNVLKKHNIDRAAFVKLVASVDGPVLQVTEEQHAPRRYFDPISLVELANFEQRHVEWLARYYTGQADTPIRAITFQTEFSDAYPSVNRLLPVYQVEFDDASNLSAFVYTELNALAALSNSWRTRLQFVFKNIHTLSWLNGFDNARVILMVLMMACVLGLSACGIGLLVLLKNRKMPTTQRRVHRAVAYLVCVPLLGFSISGLFHLLHSAYGDEDRLMQVNNMNGLSELVVSSTLQSSGSLTSLSLNSAALFETSDGQLLYRLSEAHKTTGKPMTQTQRFNGISQEKQARYIDALTGRESLMDDQQAASDVLAKLDVSGEVISAQRVTHFGPNYDFRNKRLPVWALTLDTQETVFVDVNTGIIVDRSNALKRAEGLSFSMLHKWNFLRPVMGRKSRDAVLMTVLCVSLVLVITGFVLLLRRRKQQTQQS